EEWLTAVPVFRIYGLILLQRVGQYGAVLQAFGDTRTILKITSRMVLVNAALSVPATYAIGVTGAAVGTLVASGVGWWGYQARIAELVGERVAAVMPWAHYARVLVVSCVGAFGVAAIRATLGREVSASVAIAMSFLAFALLTGGALRSSGLASRSDL